MKKNIYLCYATEDVKIAEQLCSYLEKKGMECFFRSRDIPSDEQDNMQFIGQAIDESGCIVVIVSDNLQNTKEQALINDHLDKCVVFLLDETSAGIKELGGLKCIKATRQPTKMFGHLLPELKKHLDNDSKDRSTIKIVLGTLSIFLITFFALYIFNRGGEDEYKLILPDYKDISQSEMLDKEVQAREAEYLQKELPFGGSSYGISSEEWDLCMRKMCSESGVPFNNEPQNGIELPGDTHIITLSTSKDLTLQLDPRFDDNGKLYTLRTKILRKKGLDQNLRPLLDEVLKEIIGVSDKYKNYEKYHVLKEGQLSEFYSLLKDNEIVTVRSESPYEVEVDYINIPDIPTELFEHEFLTLQFNHTNVR